MHKRSSDLEQRSRRSLIDRKSTRLNSSHLVISYAVFCLKKKKKKKINKNHCATSSSTISAQHNADHGRPLRHAPSSFPTLVFTPSLFRFFFFFFNDTATTEIYTLSLHDALPISVHVTPPALGRVRDPAVSLH